MDARLRAAAHALSVFDPLEALQGVALRDDPPALAMRGIAMAQLGEFAIARRLLRRAATAFTSTAPVARARCMASEAEVALACRDLAAAQRGFTASAATLEAYGDGENALFARLQLVRILVLLGKLNDASKSLASLELEGAAARIVAVAALIASDIAVRGVHPRAARLALDRARDAATLAAIPSLTEEVESALDRALAPAKGGCEGRGRPCLAPREERHERVGFARSGGRKDQNSCLTTRGHRETALGGVDVGQGLEQPAQPADLDAEARAERVADGARKERPAHQGLAGRLARGRLGEGDGEREENRPGGE